VADNITFDGIEVQGPLAGELVAPTINIWRDYNKRLRAKKPIVAQVNHGDKGQLVARKGQSCKVKTADGRVGWVTYTFIRELKETNA